MGRLTNFERRVRRRGRKAKKQDAGEWHPPRLTSEEKWDNAVKKAMLMAPKMVIKPEILEIIDGDTGQPIQGGRKDPENGFDPDRFFSRRRRRDTEYDPCHFDRDREAS